MLQIQEILWTMVLMDRVHPLESANPRGMLDPKRGIRVQTAVCQGMSSKGFVVWWTEHVRHAILESHQRNRFRAGGQINNPNMGAVPVR